MEHEVNLRTLNECAIRAFDRSASRLLYLRSIISKR
jgi:hypothetical protein